MTRRRAGSRWRLLVHDMAGRGGYGASHSVGQFSAPPFDLPQTEFDELVVSSWLHIEQMDAGEWWMNIGGVTVWVHADRDGRPRSVRVYGPDDYDERRDGCEYECKWTDSDVDEGGQ